VTLGLPQISWTSDGMTPVALLLGWERLEVMLGKLDRHVASWRASVI